MTITNPVNLLCRRRREHSAFVRNLRRWSLVCGFCAIGVGAGFCGVMLFGGHEQSRIAAQIQLASTDQTQAAASVATLKLHFDAANKRRHTRKLTMDRPDWSILLQMIGAHAAPEVILRELRLEAAGAGPQPGNDRALLTPEQSKLILVGSAPSQQAVSRFTMKLQDLNLFETVQLKKTGRTSVGSGVDFELHCELNNTGAAK